MTVNVTQAPKRSAVIPVIGPRQSPFSVFWNDAVAVVSLAMGVAIIIYVLARQ